MRLVVLDINVIVSAGIKPGSVPARVVMDWALDGQVQIVTCLWIVGEYREVMNREKFRRYGFPPQWLDFLIKESLPLQDPDSWLLPIPDPKDAPFLGLAHAAGAWLVTGNLKHFPAAIRGGVTVVSPAELLTRLESGLPGRS